MKTVSAAEANRQFSSLLRDVATGEVVTILARGKPVATMAPVGAEEGSRQSAKASLLQRLRQQQSSGVRSWTRDELYEG
jgi:prevent-host-death family protein